VGPVEEQDAEQSNHEKNRNIKSAHNVAEPSLILSVAQWDRRQDWMPRGATARRERDFLRLVLWLNNSNTIPGPETKGMGTASELLKAYDVSPCVRIP
jgi:hypothetical protein